MLKIGHRGASGTLPENTLAAFRAALAQGADGIELDVHRCRSGELVVIHDDTVDRTTGGSGAVAELTLTQLRALRVKGAEGERIPTLAEALDALKGAYCFVEIKHADAALAAASEIKGRVEGGWGAEKLWLISFEHHALAAARVAAPMLSIGASFEAMAEDALARAQALGARGIIPYHKPLNPAQVQAAHAQGLKVVCWTVNETADIVRLRAMGVDGIMSDYPERLTT